MFLGIRHNNLKFLIIGSFLPPLIVAYAMSLDTLSIANFLDILLFNFFWTLAIGMIAFQERISEKLYNEVNEPSPYSTVSDVEGLGVVVWLSYWRDLLKTRKFLFALLLQTLFVLGFYLLA